MRLLLLSGPRFLGYHLTEAALARGDEPTLFNRGRTAADLFPEVERRLGDRADDIESLREGEWDAVIDTSGQVPRHVRDTARLLSGRARVHVFISSISALADAGTRGQDESAPVAQLDDPDDETFSLERYAGLKAACETEAREAFDGTTIVVRPGLIVGPRDPTDRFTYWPVRMARGGEVLAPEGASVPTQLIDVRDLAAFILRLIDDTLSNESAPASRTFHAVGPEEPLPFGDLLDACRAHVGPTTRLRWLPRDFLEEQGVRPWADLPLWVPEESRGMVTIDNRAAREAGLTFRPLSETVRDTLAWYRAERAERAGRTDEPLRAGLDADRECTVLAAWRRRGRAVEKRS